jgi:hypothetical protein
MSDSSIDQAVDETPDAPAAEDFMKFVLKFMGEVPGGPEGDAEMRRRDPHPFVDVTAADVRPDRLTDAQLNSWFDYMAWNLWELIATRASEGESGLIPRQQYETTSFVQQRALYPDAVRLITERIGVDGLIDAGRQGHREVGSKVNHLRNYASALMGCLGRGVAVKLELEDLDAGRRDMEDLIQFARRTWYGTWGEGPGLASGRGFQLPLLDADVREPLLAQVESLEDPQKRALFRRFNASTELFGFMLHYDNRLGMGDTGPYPLPDGRVALIRDHFLAEDSYPWAANVIAGLPYAVTEVMVFRPGVLSFKINDIGTTFTQPSAYLEHLDEVAVFARDTRDTPLSELRKLTDEDLTRIAALSDKGVLQMYRDLSKVEYEQRIVNGLTVYSHEFIRPIARFAGVWDEVRALGFDELAPLTQKAWPVLTSDKAGEILAPVFILGGGFPRFTA